MTKKRLKTNGFRILLITWVVYLFYMSPFLQNHTENRYLSLVRSIVNHRNFEITNFQHTTLDKALFNGKFYCGAAPGNAFLGIPAYIAFKALYNLVPEAKRDNYNKAYLLQRLGQDMGKPLDSIPKSSIRSFHYKEFVLSHFFISAFVTAILSAIMALLIYRFSGYFIKDEKRRVLLTVFYAFGTIVFTYSTRLYSHVTATFFIFLAFYLLFRIKQKDIEDKYIFWAGMAAGGAILMDYFLVICWVCLFIYMVSFQKNKKNILVFIAGSSITIAILLVYHYVCFGSPFKLPYQLSPAWSPAVYEKGFLGVSFPELSIMKSLLFGSHRGYFYHMPILLLPFYSVILLVSKKMEKKWIAETLLCLGIFLALLLFNSSRIHDWNVGLSVGPRWMIPSIPFLMLLLVIISSKINFRIITGVGLFSILLNLIGAQYPEAYSLLPRISSFLCNPLTSPVGRFSLENSMISVFINALFIILLVITVVLITKTTNGNTRKKAASWILIGLLFTTMLSNYFFMLKIRDKHYMVFIPHYSTTLVKSNKVFDVPIFDAPLCSGIRIESVLANSMDVKQDYKVASLEVFHGKEEMETFDIIAGRDTAEWAWSQRRVKSSIKHKKASISKSWIRLGKHMPFVAHEYYADYKFEKPIEPTRIRISFSTNDSFKLILNNAFFNK